MRDIFFVRVDISEGKFWKWSLYYHDVVEIELYPTIDFSSMKQFMVDYSYKTIKVVELIFELWMLTAHIIKIEKFITHKITE